jgi:chorismate mutase
MEKQQHNQLLEFRKQIDEIDQKIIDLLKARMEVVAQVGKCKEKAKDRFFIKSNREADMIKNLTNKIGNSLPKSAIVTIWRKIISSANILEQNLKIGIYNPQNSEKYYYLTREYYGDFIPIINFDNSAQILAEISKNNIQLAVFALPNNSDENSKNQWWIDLANQNSELKIFAKFPFIKYEKNQDQNQDNLVVLALKEAEESQSDRTLFVINSDSNSVEKTLEESGFSAKILAKSQQNYLIEIDGFFRQNDEKFQSLENHKMNLKIIGHYPIPIILK